MERKSEAVFRKCPHCGEVVENPNINYYPKCRNMHWSQRFARERKY